MNKGETGIMLVDYDPTWTDAFEREARAIRNSMGLDARRIEHVGSTAIPGLAAKPIIDIQVSVAHLRPLEIHQTSLKRIGYGFVSLPVPEDSNVEHADDVYPFFQKPSTWPSTHHVHLCASGSVQERDHIVFRNYLRDHPDRMASYATLKNELMAEHSGITLVTRERYSLGKTKFVAETLELALVAGYD